MLMKLSQFRKDHYADGSRPTWRTLKKWAENNELPYCVEKHGNTLYIDLDKPSTNDPETQRLIESVLHGT